MLLQLFQDAFFAALAAVGFSAISSPPRKAIAFCALIAAVGHASRFMLINYCGMHIVVASLIAAVIVGLLAVVLAPRAKCPPETFSYPALLPMIPGIYAYKCLQGITMTFSANSEVEFNHYFYLFESNGVICLFVILAMVVGQLLPRMLFNRIAFSATK